MPVNAHRGTRARRKEKYCHEIQRGFRAQLPPAGPEEREPSPVPEKRKAFGKLSRPAITRAEGGKRLPHDRPRVVPAPAVLRVMPEVEPEIPELRPEHESRYESSHAKGASQEQQPSEALLLAPYAWQLRRDGHKRQQCPRRVSQRDPSAEEEKPECPPPE